MRPQAHPEANRCAAAALRPRGKGKGAGGAFAAGGGATERTFLWSASGGPLSTEGKGRKLAPGLRPPGSPRRGGRTSYGSCQCGQPLPPRQVCTEFRCRPRIMQPREFGSRSVGLGANKGRNGCLRVRQWVSGKEAAAASLPANRIAEGLHRSKPPSWKGRPFRSPGAGMPLPVILRPGTGRRIRTLTGEADSSLCSE